MKEFTIPKVMPPVKRRRVKLGDAVHAIAHPVAKVIDKLAGTDFQKCKGCGERRERWNRL